MFSNHAAKGANGQASAAVASMKSQILSTLGEFTKDSLPSLAGILCKVANLGKEAALKIAEDYLNAKGEEKERQSKAISERMAENLSKFTKDELRTSISDFTQWYKTKDDFEEQYKQRLRKLAPQDHDGIESVAFLMWQYASKQECQGVEQAFETVKRYIDAKNSEKETLETLILGVVKRSVSQMRREEEGSADIKQKVAEFGKLVDASKQLTAYQSKAENLEAKVRQDRSEISQLSQENEATKIGKEKNAQLAANTIMKLRDYVDEIKKHEMEVKALKARIDGINNYKRSLESEVKSQKTEIEVLERDANKYQKQVSQQEIAIKQMTGECNEYKTKVIAKASDNDSLKKEKQQLSEKAATLEGLLGKANFALGQTKEQLDAQLKEKQELQRRISDADEQITKFAKQINQLDAELAREKSKPTEDPAKVKELNGKLEIAERDMAELRDAAFKLSEQLQIKENEAVNFVKEFKLIGNSFLEKDRLLGELNSEYNALKKKVGEVSAEKEKEIRALSETVSKKEELLKKATDDCDAARQELSQKEGLLNKLNGDYSAAKQELSHKEKQIEEISTERSKLEQKNIEIVVEKDTAIKSLEQKVEAAQKETEMAHKETALEKETKDKIVAAVKEKDRAYEGIDAQIKETKDKMAELGKVIEANQKELIAKNDRMQILGSSIEQLNKQLAEQETSYKTEIKSQSQSHKEEIEKQNQNYRTEIERQKQSYLGELAAVTKQKTAIEQQLGIKKKLADNLEAQCRKYEADISQQNTKIDGLKKDQKSLENEVRKAENFKIWQNGTIETLDKKLTEKSLALNSLRDEAGRLRQDINQATAQYGEQKKLVESYFGEIKTLTKDMFGLRDSFGKRIKEAEGRMAELGKAIETKQKELTEAKSYITTIETEMKGELERQKEMLKDEKFKSGMLEAALKNSEAQRADYAKNSEAKCAKYENQIASHETKYKDDIAKLEKGNEENVANLKNDYENQLAKLKEQYEKQIKQLNEAIVSQAVANTQLNQKITAQAEIKPLAESAAQTAPQAAAQSVAAAQPTQLKQEIAKEEPAKEMIKYAKTGATKITMPNLSIDEEIIKPLTKLATMTLADIEKEQKEAAKLPKQNAQEPASSYKVCENITALLESGSKKCNQWNYKGALADFKQALKSSWTLDEHKLSYAWLERAYSGLGKQSKAIKMADKAYEFCSAGEDDLISKLYWNKGLDKLATKGNIDALKDIEKSKNYERAADLASTKPFEKKAAA